MGTLTNPKKKKKNSANKFNYMIKKKNQKKK